MVAPQRLSNLQMELLKIYSFNPSEDEMLAIKKMLACFFSGNMIAKIGSAVESKGISEADLEQWLNDEN